MQDQSQDLSQGLSRDQSRELKIVVIGGGSGSSSVLRGLKHRTPNLAAVVTMFDSGGSSGLLHTEFGYPPLGDLRQCMLGLSEDSESNRALRDLLDFRFQLESSLHGHSLGNLLLAALTTIGMDLELAIDEMSRLLHITGRVIPVALEHADLCAELDNGEIVVGESNIDLRGKSYPRIKRVFLEPSVIASPRAIEAILEADVVVLGPGDLFTSIVPNLLAQGIPEALAQTRATRIYVCNLMTKLGETDDFKASDFVRQVVRYLNGPHLDWALINTQEIPPSVRQAYFAEGAFPVACDVETVRNLLPGVFVTHLGNNQVPLKHDHGRIADSVLRIADMGRVQNTINNTNGQGSLGPNLQQSMVIGHRNR
jgi:uncharacterized cofD-like protein